MRHTVGRLLSTFVFLSLVLPGISQAQSGGAQDDSLGFLRGTGKHFDLDPAASLVSAVDSSVVISVQIAATPRSFVMPVNPDPQVALDASLAYLTLSGLAPSTTYYRYTDDFEHLDVLVSDESGRTSFDLDLTAPHVVIVQPNPSTIHLRADGTGCPFIGTFDAATLTCKLRRDVSQTIEIDDDGVTLDGNGFKIDGTSPLVGSSGVLVGRRIGVAVRNLVIDGAPTGVIVNGATDSTFESITVRNGNGGFLELFTTPSAGTGRNTYRNNSVSVVCATGVTPPCGFGFSGLFDNQPTVTGNTIADAKSGIVASLAVSPVISGNTLDGCDTGISTLVSLTDATYAGNTITGSSLGLMISGAVECTVQGNHIAGATGEALRLGGRGCTVTDNVLSTSAVGLNVQGNDNVIHHNHFVGNVTQAEVSSGTGNRFSEDPRVGGNFWSTYDEPGEGCSDLDADGYCDAPLELAGGMDERPWAAEAGWLDLLPPSTAVSLFGLAGNGGWFRSDVTATFSAADDPDGTGVLRSEYGFDGVNFTPADGPVTLSAEGTTDLFYRSIDRAGDAEAPHSVPVMIDVTNPSIDASLAPPANAAGWNRANVVVNFSCADSVSGVASCADPASVTAEGAGQTVSGAAEDVAGNSATTSATVNLDRTAPDIAFAGACGTSFLLNQSASTSVLVTDALSGVASQSASNGSHALTTGTVGPHSFPVSAADRADNPATAACAYSVIYDFLGAGGFHSPIDNPPVVNIAKSGSTIPVKWQLPDGLGGYVSDLAAVASIRSQQVLCSNFDNSIADPVEATTSGSSGLRFDPTDMQFVYNWKTDKSVAGRCLVLILSLSDGRSYQANFRFNR